MKIDFSRIIETYLDGDLKGTDLKWCQEERLAEIHIELDGLDEEAVKLASLISENYKSL